MKKFLKIGILIYLFFIPVIVNAKSYTINYANFDVMLFSDGDADVTETWNITFNDGDFTRFYKDIYKNVTEVEKYDDISFSSFYINDKLLTKADNSLDRKDYTYFISSTTDLYTINFYKSASSGDTLTYKVSYTLNNVIKETDNNNAIFVYRYIGANFDQDINKININITNPYSNDIVLVHSSKKKYESNIEDNTIKINTKGSGLTKIAVRFPSSDFYDLTYISSDDINYPDENGEIIAIVVLVVVFIIFAIFIVYIMSLLIKSIVERKKAKKILAENPNIAIEYINKYETSGIHFLNILMSYNYLSPYEKIMFELLILLKEKKAIINNEEIKINHSITGIDYDIVYILLQFVPHSEDNNDYIIKLSDLNDLTISGTDRIEKMNKKLSAEVTLGDEIKFDKYEKEIIKYYITQKEKYLNIDNYIVFSNIIENNILPTTEVLFALNFYSNKVKVNTATTDNCLYFSYYYDQQITTSHTSSSSSGGCSSCSSCSGCGGGGAD